MSGLRPGEDYEEPSRVALVHPVSGAAFVPAFAGGARILYSIRRGTAGGNQLAAGEVLDSGPIDLQLDELGNKWRNLIGYYFTTAGSATNGWVVTASVDGNAPWRNLQTATIAAVTALTVAPNIALPWRYVRWQYTNGAAAADLDFVLQGSI